MHRPVCPDENVVDGTGEEDKQSSNSGQTHKETRIPLDPGALLHAITPIVLISRCVASLVHRSIVRLAVQTPSRRACPG